ncbi:peptidoglycan-binding domain-containing protein [Kitasatospora sp. NPDC048538]|uniref:peptidoglycan-binding domain-containing protein n=1 Tax=unclassified Kitasatospora TaxID=2633591 RepID=UPI003401EA8F
MRMHTWTRRAATLAVGAAAALALTVGSANAAGSISKGMSGPNVKCLQRALNDVDAAGLEPDSSFGILTYNAVVDFQDSHGLRGDGIVGPLTGGAIKSVISTRYNAGHGNDDPLHGELGDWLSGCSSQLPG